MLRHTRNDVSPSGVTTAPDKVAEDSLAVWRDIPGYYYTYRVSDYGVVQRYIPSKKTWRTLKPYKNGGKDRRRVAVKLIVEPNKPKHVPVVDIMADAFMGGRAAHPNKVLVHKNHNGFDCALHNLEWCTLHECGVQSGKRSGRKPIFKIDRQGNVVEVYSSGVECCKHEYITHSTLWRIMHGKYKDPYVTTGFTYKFEEEMS